MGHVIWHATPFLARRLIQGGVIFDCQSAHPLLVSYLIMQAIGYANQSLQHPRDCADTGDTIIHSWTSRSDAARPPYHTTFST